MQRTIGSKSKARNKALIFYFSGTGNTWLAASSIAQELKARGFAADLLALEEAPLHLSYEDYTILGIGFPVYGCTAPMMVYDYVKRMPRGQGKKAFVFSTMGALTWGSEAMIAGMLSRKGYDVLDGRAFIAPYNDRFLNVPEPDLPGAPHTEKKINTMRACSKQLVSDLVERRTRIERNTPAMVLGSIAVQYLLKFFVPLLYICLPYLKFQANSNCNSCGLCERICPKGNIRSSRTRPRIGHRCEVCERCANFCPKKAVRFGIALDFVQYRAPGYRPPILREPTGG